MWGWSVAYYVALILLYRFLIHDYIAETLDRQLLGLSDTLALTAVLFAYLIMCALPAFLWSRKGQYHPVWRGLEAFACYVVVALVLGAVLAAAGGGDWSVTSAFAASGGAWAGIGSVLALLALFQAASWWGGNSAAGRRRHAKSKRRKQAKKSGA